MEMRSYGLEHIRERFRVLGLGASLPKSGNAWTRLGDHVHWLDLIGISEENCHLDSIRPTTIPAMLRYLGGDVVPVKTGAWFHLGFPVGVEAPLERIAGSVSPRGRQGEFDNQLFELMRRCARRNPKLIPILLEQARKDFRFRVRRNREQPSEPSNSCIAMRSFLVESGNSDDLTMLCEVFDRYTSLGQAHLVCDVHARGWELAPCFLDALESCGDGMIQGLHEGLMQVRKGVSLDTQSDSLLDTYGAPKVIRWVG
jgi:hypothetical protein